MKPVLSYFWTLAKMMQHFARLTQSFILLINFLN
jgi:hypothetical protein